MNVTIKITCKECKEPMLPTPWKHWEAKHPEILAQIKQQESK